MLLSKEIKLTSQQWCDYVFDNKNKNYGAYQMRRTSSNRHILALIIVTAFAILAVAVPAAIAKVRATIPQWHSGDGTIVLVEIPDKPEKPRNNIQLDVPPPPSPTVATIVFTVPVMVSTGEITDENILRTQDDIVGSNTAVGISDNVGEEGGFVHPDIVETPIFERPVTKVDDKIEIVPAHAPEYPGGLSELYSFVGKNLCYPAIPRDLGIQGTANIQFVVERDGSVSGITLLRGFDDACNKEALRVIKLMAQQKWVPGRDGKGNAVRSYFTIPIRFRINEK
ncbi:MAG: energy transducer TonB [Paludibacter sp.]|nr:energy transducer TonB [Paludibacter sp.]